MKRVIILSITFLMTSMIAFAQGKAKLKTVAEMDMRPGNVAVDAEGRIFTTIHPLGNPNANLQLIEITGKDSFEPFPSVQFRSIILKCLSSRGISFQYYERF